MTPTNLYNIEAAGVPSRPVEHAMSSFLLSCTCCSHWAGGVRVPTKPRVAAGAATAAGADLYIFSRIFAVRRSLVY